MSEALFLKASRGCQRVSAGSLRVFLLMPPCVPRFCLCMLSKRGGGNRARGGEGNKTIKINKNWKRKRKDQMHQKASGPQWGLPLSKLASLGNSANYSRPYKPSSLFFWLFFFFCLFGFAFGLI